jgi:hypothetical protein
MARNYIKGPILSSSTASTSTSLQTQTLAFVGYDASGCASAELWAILGDHNIHNVGKAIDAGSATASASTSITSTLGTGTRHYDYTVFNKTLILVNGNDANQNLIWTRASGWNYWSGTCSGTSVGILAGISQFKQRLIGWEKNNTVFWYGSTDQVYGTMNSFDLGGVINTPLKMFATLSKDGGGGPDDYALFISEGGEVAMYAGNDPGDVDRWELVGVFKIGRPIGVNAHINYGHQTVVLCEDDFYFLPEDLAGKRGASLASDSRTADKTALQTTNAVYYEKEGVILFSDGSMWSIDGNFSYSNLTLSSAEPWKVRQQPDFHFAPTHSAMTSQRPPIAKYKGQLYSLPSRSGETTELNNCVRVNRLLPPPAPLGSQIIQPQKYTAKIRTAPIKTQGRTNISLVNPLFGLKDVSSAETSAYGASFITYRTGALYDTAWQPERNLSLDSTAEFFVTTSASSNSYGYWTPAFGTGDNPQIIIEMASATQGDDQNLMLHGIDLIVEDTGGM